jgi:FtsZ-binding cell division protein ZapB
MPISLAKNKSTMRKLSDAESLLLKQVEELWIKNSNLRKENEKLKAQNDWLNDYNKQLARTMDHRVRMEQGFPRATSGY